MTNEFNKKVMLDNITYALKEFGKRIGEFEAETGVSAGYISRTSKDENAKPGIDFVVKAANVLNMSVDTLINVDLNELTPTEKYLVSFFEKLIKDSLDDKLDWNKETAHELNNVECDINGYAYHSMMEYKTFLLPGETDYPEEHNGVIFVSNTFGDNTCIEGDCFNLRLKNDTYIYLMNLSKAVYRTTDPERCVKEIWMNHGCNKEFICSNRDEKLGSLVEHLFNTVSERYKHPKIKTIYKSAMDAFMNDDLDDDMEYIEATYHNDIPF